MREDLGRRVERVKELVPPLRRAQVIRDLCVVANADGVVTSAETEILLELAEAVEVSQGVVIGSLDKGGPLTSPLPRTSLPTP